MTDFNTYIEYLERVKGSLPKHIYEFAKDQNRHNLTSPHSLHDSWISSIKIKENRNKERPFDLTTTIEIELLGSIHDRDIILNYTNIQSYQINGNQNKYNSNDTFHGDIDRHEIRVTNNLMEHVIWLQSNSMIKIVFEDLEIKERMHNTD